MADLRNKIIKGCLFFWLLVFFAIFGAKHTLAQDEIYLSAKKLEQGDTLFIKTNFEPKSAKLGTEKIDFFKPDNSEIWLAIVGIKTKKQPGKYNLIITTAEGKKIKKEIKVVKRKFPVSNFSMTKDLENKGYSVNKVINDALNKENPDLYSIFKDLTPIPYFNQPFIYPLQNIKKGGSFGFGNYKKNKDVLVQHLGADLGAALNTPVYAINDGVVSYSEILSTYGKTLVIDHGLGIYSLYLHLNEFKFSKGDKVKRGDIIALSGNTGYSLGPHLHFSVKVNGVSVDPIRFIATIEKSFPKPPE